jgi:purine catabolism regulator
VTRTETRVRDYLTIADLVSMPQLGLRLVGGHEGSRNSVLWTHTSELEDPGPWLEGGELLIVNGFGIPADAGGQVGYVTRLARHRLAGLVVSVKAPDLTEEMLEAANRLDFPVLRVPREVPFIELSYLVANASERSARGRLSRHLRIFETLRFRNSVQSNVVEVYSQLEQVSGYRLALVTPARHPLLADWPWVPENLELPDPRTPADLQVVADGYVLPLLVDSRVTAYLVGKEHSGAVPGGLAALQHVGTLAALDAIDDQRRREALHREGSALLSRALDGDGSLEELTDRFGAVGLGVAKGFRVLALGEQADAGDEIEVRDWLADRALPHLLLREDTLLAVVCHEIDDELDALCAGLEVYVGASPVAYDLNDLSRLRRQALWALNIARDSAQAGLVRADQESGLARWITPDVETLRQLATATLAPLRTHDADNGGELVHTLTVYFQHQGRLRPAAAELFVHEHTLSYRLKRIEQLTGRSLKAYRDIFELWLAVEMKYLVDEA